MNSLAERRLEDDFPAWAFAQAEAPRRFANAPHLIEEVEDLARAERHAVRGQLRRIIEDCLQLDCSGAANPRPGWYDSIADARAEIEDKLTPTVLRDLLDDGIARLYQRARDVPAGAMRRHGEAAAAALLPTDCPDSLDDLLRHDWHPDSRHGFHDSR